MEFQKKNTPEVVFFLYKIVDVIGKQWLCRATAIIFIVFVASLILAIIHPIAGEAWVYNLTVISGILTAGLVGMLAAVGIGTAVNLGTILISVGVKEAKAINNTKALPAGDMFSIHPDILIWQRLDETQNQFEDRINSAVKNRGSAWIAVIAYQDIYIRVQDFSPEGFWTHRSDETLHLPQYAESVFVNETEQEYHQYLHDVCPRIRSAFMEKKTKKSKNALQPLMQQSLNVLVFLLLSVSLFSQTNTDKVKTAVSANDITPTAGQQVHYVFSDGSSATRTADGQKKISELFSAGYIGADNIQRGEVVGIDVDRRPVDIKVKIAATGTNEKPAPLFKTHMDPHNEVVPQKSFTESLPDSATVARELTYVQDALPTYKQKIRQFFMPIIDFMSALLLFFSPLFAIVLGLCNLVSRSAASNGNLGELVRRNQVKFAAFAWWISVLLYSCIYLGVTFSLFFWECHPLIISVVCFLLYLPAEWVINWLTPNGQFRASKHGKPHRGGDNYPGLPG